MPNNLQLYFHWILAVSIINQIGFTCEAQENNIVFKSSNQNVGGKNDKILSRTKRFLQFPEGSSFQVVYDQTIPIIGVTKLFTVGITVALAYQLPSISLNEITKILQEQAAEGLHLRRKDENVNDTLMVDASASKFEQTNRHSYYYTNDNKVQYYMNNNNESYASLYPLREKVSSNNQFNNLTTNFISPFNYTKNDWNGIVSRYFLTWLREHPPNYNLSRRKFYPVFGKRSIDQNTDPEDKYFLDHHRSTRHELYAKIEKFLDAKGKNGHQCVLRALCESGQRRNTYKPDKFLKEILKAIFSIPKSHETPANLKHKMYDEAHGHRGDCAVKYSLCQDSFWSAEFKY